MISKGSIYGNLTKLSRAVEKKSSQTKIIIGLSLAIVIALILTVISVGLYISSGVSRLDLSRPGYEPARQGVNEKSATKTFDNSGDMDAKAIGEFTELYDEQQSVLENTSSFSDNNLDDAQLNFVP